MQRRDFLKTTAATAASAFVGPVLADNAQDVSVVYFTKTIAPEKALELFKKLEIELPGKTAVKIHSGEPGGNHFLKPEFIKPLVDEVEGVLVECNTAYQGRRHRSEDHWKALEQHGFTKIAPCDVLDEDGELELPVPNGKRLTVNYVGANLKKYDSALVLSHFKGHMMGGFGGALKNISIGIASANGKAVVHGAGDASKMWTCPSPLFQESMADAALTVVNFFKNKIAFVSAMKDLSVDCDCNAHPKAPEMSDIGVLASLDPVALDQACVDLIYASDEPGKAGLIERMESRSSARLLEAAEELGVGSRKYRLVEIA